MMGGRNIIMNTIQRFNTIRVASMCGILAGIGLSACADDTALTIYSTARPGAVAPETYRPTPGYVQGYNAYNSVPGYALIRQDRTLDIADGLSSLKFTDVAAYLDPTTVRFESLSDPDGTTVIEQDYRFDLLSMGKMLERYIDQKIIYNGAHMTLLSVAGGGMLLQGDSGEVIYQQGYNGVRFPSLDQSLVTKPTLMWSVFSEEGGEQETRVTYQTTGITWWADYNLILTPGESANDVTISLGAWVSILNQSGGSYENAKLKLVAGDVNRAQPVRHPRRQEMMFRGDVAMDAAPAGFEEKSFFEYHLYTLGRPTTIPDRSTKQIELFDAASNIPAKKVMLFDGSAGARWYGSEPMMDRGWGVHSNAKVAVYLAFENSEDHGLGIPLPSGRIRVNQMDTADGAFEFIGEDVIDHTPKNEEIRIKLGNAFDIVGERKQVSFKSGRGWAVETFEIKVRNRKDEPVEVHVQEHLYRWTNATITESSHEYEMVDAQTMLAPVHVDADSETVMTYTVRYMWGS